MLLFRCDFNYIHSLSSDLGPRHVKLAATEALNIEELSSVTFGKGMTRSPD
jgi:hypothetical protein